MARLDARRMILLCYLPPQSLAQVMRAFPSPHRVLNAVAWDAVLSDVRHLRADVAVIDPCLGGDHNASSRLDSLARVSGDCGAVPVVGYLSVSAPAMRAAMSLARLGATEILIRGVDDSVASIGAAIQRAFAVSSARRVIAAVREPLRSLPRAIASAIMEVFHHPERVHCVGDLATAANTTRRTLDRWLARAGLASARTVVACARAPAAFHLISSGHVRRATAASLLGYASPRSLGREMVAMTGYPAARVSAGMSRDAFVAALGRKLVRDSSERSRLVASY
jgi:AraC-like DNA-binding protein